MLVFEAAVCVGLPPLNRSLTHPKVAEVIGDPLRVTIVGGDDHNHTWKEMCDKIKDG